VYGDVREGHLNIRNKPHHPAYTMKTLKRKRHGDGVGEPDGANTFKATKCFKTSRQGGTRAKTAGTENDPAKSFRGSLETERQRADNKKKKRTAYWHVRQGLMKHGIA